MSEESSRKIPATFRRVDRSAYGYSVAQVDDFMERARAIFEDPENAPELSSTDVRKVAFDGARGGYDATQVDHSLDILEDALAHKERDGLISEKGEEAWLSEVGRLSALLRQRLYRPSGEKFRHPSKAKTQGYSVTDVEALCQEIVEYLENDHALSVDDVRRSAFGPAKGTDAYEEAQVDAFLDRVVELMAAID
ncbi:MULTISPECIES: DivIVA domain-containing protein [Arthrobacter]|uniref:DivIVA domain-containing protein n=2 Tax=Arthrobacter TaxID=1663 RepID=A0ABU9KMZ6_9MICC|nr:DivIVA domain-containing protein [Arthrobacter sp. YJM1]MDP5228224.1 DivIVA domain-containing protein [Arthrobacter sp. YJM1]